MNKHRKNIEDDFKTCPPHTVSEAQARIEQLTGIKRSQTKIRKFLRRLGLKLSKTAIVPGKVDDDKIDEQRKFKEDQLDPCIKEAQEQKRKLFLLTPLILSMERFCAFCGLSTGLYANALRAITF